MQKSKFLWILVFLFLLSMDRFVVPLQAADSSSIFVWENPITSLKNFFGFFFTQKKEKKISPETIKIKSPYFSTADQEKAKAYLTSIIESHKSSRYTPSQIVGFQIEAVKAYQAENAYDVIQNCSHILAENPHDLTAWFLIAATGIKKDSSYKSEALSATILAYSFASTPEEKALALYFFSQIIEKKDNSKLSEALQKYKPEDLMNSFLESIKHYPHIFTVYNTLPQEKADSGSIALAFSKPLKKLKKFRYEDYVSLDPANQNISVVAKGSQLILSGLTFGQAYRITLKKGLPAESQYQLTEDQIVPVYIEHRKPIVEFRERGYILPSKAPQLLPLKSINTASAKIRVLRLSIPNILTQMNTSSFLVQLGAWQLSTLESTEGELIAEGTFDCSGETDDVVTKGLSIEQVIGKRLETGVYIVQASGSKDEQSTQWLVISDIGLSTLSGPDGLHISTRSLSTAAPLSNVQVTLLARNGKVLASRSSDSQGHLLIEDSLLKGQGSFQPALICAELNKSDFTFIDYLKDGFDFSDRGSTGREPIHHADSYIYTERGVYRPGDTVKIVGLLRDQKGKALKNVPLTFKIFRPDLLEISQKVIPDQGAGAHAFDFQTQPSNHTGTWKITAHLDPKAESISETTFLLEDFIPPRIKAKCHVAQKLAKPFEPIKGSVKADYFYGAPADGLAIDSTLNVIEEKKPFEKWKDFQFGRVEETWTPLTFKMNNQETDEKGQAHLESSVATSPHTSKPLAAEFKGNIYESTGRPVPFSAKIPFWNQPYLIGLRAQLPKSQSAAMIPVTFDIIAVNAQGNLKEVKEATYTLYSEEQTYTWYRSGQDWKYEASTEAYPQKEGKLKLEAGNPTSLKDTLEYGAYRLEVLDPQTGVTSSLRFHVGWTGEATSPDHPDMLELTLDKPSYKQGDTLHLTVNTPFEGFLSVDAADNEKMKRLFQGEVSEKRKVLDFKIDPQISTEQGFYLLVTAFQPANNQSQKMPKRAVGLIWVDLKQDLSKIDFEIQAPEVVRPETTVDVSIAVKNPQKKLYVTLAAVDESLLLLTRYETPNPFGHFFSQTRFAYLLRDSYSNLINPYGSKPGTFNVGGGGELTEALSAKALASLGERTFKTFSLFSGIVDNFDIDPKTQTAVAKIPLTLPDFSGEVRLMAVVWNEDTVASHEMPLLVRDPIESYLGLPLFLAPKDKTDITFDVQNLKETAEECTIKLTTLGSVSLKEPFSKKITLKPNESAHLPLTLETKDNGKGTLKLHIEASNNIIIDKEWSISVRSPVYETTQRKGGVLQPGESLTLDSSTFANLIPSTGILNLNIGHVPSFGTQNLIASLKAYPYGCLEQTVSRLAAEFYNPEGDDKDRVKELFSYLASLQRFDGTFSLWSSNETFSPWLTLYAIDLLSRFQNKYENKVMLERGQSWLKQYGNKTQVKPEEISEYAYAHYLLAREKLGTLGKLKYFADLYGKDIKKTSDHAFLGAAFAHYGDMKEADLWFKKATSLKNETIPLDNELFFSSSLSEEAILTSLVAEVSLENPKVVELSRVLFDQVDERQYLNTFEKAWVLRVAYDLEELQKPVRLDINGAEAFEKKGFQETYDEKDVTPKLVFTNKDSDPVFYLSSISGEPKDPSKLANAGFEIRRSVHTLDGESVDLSTLRPGDNLIVVLEGELLEKGSHEVILLDLLPAGFEIEKTLQPDPYNENPYPWLKNLSPLSRVEKRDDRYFAVTHLNKEGPFKAAYIVRATKPGTYAYPSTFVESMYHPEFSARSTSSILTIGQ